MLLIVLVFFVVILCVFTFLVPCCYVLFPHKNDIQVRLYLQLKLVCRRARDLFTLFVFACVNSGVQRILCCVGFFFFFFCLRLVSGIPNVASLSGLFILDCPFRLFNIT